MDHPEELAAAKRYLQTDDAVRAQALAVVALAEGVWALVDMLEGMTGDYGPTLKVSRR